MLVGSCSGIFLALDRRTGSERWGYDTRLDGDPAEFHGDPLVAGDLVITGCDRTGLAHTYAFDIPSGDVVWKRTGSVLESDIVSAAGRAVGRRWNGDLLAVDLGTGELLWAQPPVDYTYPFWADASPVCQGDTIFYGGVDGIVYAVDGWTGDVIWAHDTGDAITTTVAVDGDDVYAGLAGDRLLWLAAGDGGLRGEIQLQDRPFGRLAVAGDNVIVLTGDGDLVAIARDLHAELWKREGEPLWTSPQPLLWREMVVVGSSRGTVHGFRADSGETAFEVTLGGRIRGLGAANDVIYVGTYNGVLYACRPHVD